MCVLITEKKKSLPLKKIVLTHSFPGEAWHFKNAVPCPLVTFHKATPACKEEAEGPASALGAGTVNGRCLETPCSLTVPVLGVTATHPSLQLTFRDFQEPLL